MHTQLQKSKKTAQTAATIQKKSNSSKTKSLQDNRAATNATQLMSKAHGKSCGCSACGGTSQMKVKKENASGIAQLTCDDGHKQHKKGPCPDSDEGKMLRMQGKHGGGKPHGKKAKSRPKKRQEKYDQQALDEVRRRRGGGNGGNGNGQGGAGGVLA